MPILCGFQPLKCCQRDNQKAPHGAIQRLSAVTAGSLFDYPAFTRGSARAQGSQTSAKNVPQAHFLNATAVLKEIISAKQRGTQMQKNTPWNACIPRALFFGVYATTVATEMERSGIEVPRCFHPGKNTFPGYLAQKR